MELVLLGMHTEDDCHVGLVIPKGHCKDVIKDLSSEVLDAILQFSHDVIVEFDRGIFRHGIQLV